jgi:methyl-accepting chemotaxis protein
MTLKTKLGIGFGTNLVIMLCLATFSYINVGKLDEYFSLALDKSNELEKSQDVELGIEKQTTGVRGFLLAGREDLLTRDNEGQQQYHSAIKALQEKTQSSEGQKLLSDLSSRYDVFRAVLDQEIQLRRAGHANEAEELAFSSSTSNLRKDLRDAASGFVEFQRRKLEQEAKEQDDIVAVARHLTIVLTVLGLGFCGAIAFFLSRSLTQGVQAMSGLLQEIANSNLSVPDLEITSHDEIGQAGSTLNGMKNNLREMIQSIAQTATHVASASEQLSATTMQQARGAETQKDQTVHVATAMQEMVSTVSQVSDNANEAADASRQAAETARKGGTILEDTVAKMHLIVNGARTTARKMEELGKASDQIGHIVGVIEDIADQTNLLALNAAIEAARAGEQGRGFAVVADEVRKLAERTTGATKEIAQMVKNIQGETRLAVTAMEADTKQVEEGAKSTSNAGESLKEIIRMSERVGEMITNIAAAATEQHSTSAQVNQNMEQITRLVGESTMGSQQAAQACQELSSLALDLQHMVNRFQLSQSSSTPQGRARTADRPFSSASARARAATAN